MIELDGQKFGGWKLNDKNDYFIYDIQPEILSWLRFQEIEVFEFIDILPRLLYGHRSIFLQFRKIEDEMLFKLTWM